MRKLLIGFTVVLFIGSAGGFFYLRNYHSKEYITRNGKRKEIVKGDVGEYVAGEVIVQFKDGTKYKEAKEFLHSLGYDIEAANSNWKAMDFTPNEDTELSKLNLFTIEVGKGNEDKVIKKFKESELVLRAMKNAVGHLDNVI